MGFCRQNKNGPIWLLMRPRRLLKTRIELVYMLDSVFILLNVINFFLLNVLTRNIMLWSKIQRGPSIGPHRLKCVD